mmetsp:Transcript_40634/g.122743  ORF Transcript_40634/g.122743 Transcript_40634/m.122743 type:complete len:234 (-) Transcript_40634:306-1007(-)
MFVAHVEKLRTDAQGRKWPQTIGLATREILKRHCWLARHRLEGNGFRGERHADVRRNLARHGGCRVNGVDLPRAATPYLVFEAAHAETGRGETHFGARPRLGRDFRLHQWEQSVHECPQGRITPGDQRARSRKTRPAARPRPYELQSHSGISRRVLPSQHFQAVLFNHSLVNFPPHLRPRHFVRFVRINLRRERPSPKLVGVRDESYCASAVGEVGFRQVAQLLLGVSEGVIS